MKQFFRCLFGKHVPIALSDGLRTLVVCEFCGKVLLRMETKP